MPKKTYYRSYTSTTNTKGRREHLIRIYDDIEYVLNASEINDCITSESFYWNDIMRSIRHRIWEYRSIHCIDSNFKDGSHIIDIGGIPSIACILCGSTIVHYGMIDIAGDSIGENFNLPIKPSK